MIDTNSEEHRFACEARHVCNLGRSNSLAAKKYLELVAARRGDEASRKLRDAAAAMFRQSMKEAA